MDALESDERSGIAGPRILEGDDPSRIWSAGGDLVIRENVGRLRGKGRSDGPEFDEATEVDFVTGCVMAVRRRALEEIGLFDADYFAYLEDIDLCVRAREAGYRVLYVPAARARHRESSSTGGGYTVQRKYWMGRNSVIFLRRHGRFGHWLAFVVFAVMGLPIAWAREAGRGNAAGVRAKAQGILDGLRGRKGAPA